MQVCPDLGRVVGLRKLLPEAEIHGPDDVAVSGCACDSRRVRQGELFAALAGRRHDGHDFIAEAVARGCAAVMTDRGGEKGDSPRLCEAPFGPFRQTGAVPLFAPVPVCVVPNARESYARLCQTLAGSPSRRLKMIGVSGRSGKTATSCLIAGVLRAAGHRAGIVGTLGHLDGRIVEQATHATPPPERLAPLLARMVRNDCSHAVMEVSSRALDQSRVAGVEFERRLRDQRHPGEKGDRKALRPPRPGRFRRAQRRRSRFGRIPSPALLPGIDGGHRAMYSSRSA